MQEENEYVQDEVVEQEENTTTEEESAESDDTVTISKTEFNKLRRQAIAYKANKEAPKQEVKDTHTTNSFTKQEIQEEILIAKGVDSQLLEEMKALSLLRGKSLLEMEHDPIIIAMKEVKEAEAKAKAARLGASRGSTSVKAQKSTTTSGLSDDEHRAMWKELNSK